MLKTLPSFVKGLGGCRKRNLFVNPPKDKGKSNNHDNDKADTSIAGCYVCSCRYVLYGEWRCVRFPDRQR